MLKSGMSVSRMPEPKRFPAALHIALETGVSVLLELYVVLDSRSARRAKCHFLTLWLYFVFTFQSPRVCVH